RPNPPGPHRAESWMAHSRHSPPGGGVRMTAPTFAKLAAEVGDNIEGQRDAEQFVARLAGGYPDPDELMRAILLAQGKSPARLRGLCRGLQKAIERTEWADA